MCTLSHTSETIRASYNNNYNNGLLPMMIMMMMFCVCKSAIAALLFVSSCSRLRVSACVCDYAKCARESPGTQQNRTTALYTNTHTGRAHKTAQSRSTESSHGQHIELRSSADDGGDVTTLSLNDDSCHVGERAEAKSFILTAHIDRL